jgi:aconitate hydratase
LAPGDRIEIEAPLADLAPRMAVPVTIRRASGAAEIFAAAAAIETSLEVDLLRTGGIIPFILQRAIARSAGSRSGALENQV